MLRGTTLIADKRSLSIRINQCAARITVGGPSLLTGINAFSGQFPGEVHRFRALPYTSRQLSAPGKYSYFTRSSPFMNIYHLSVFDGACQVLFLYFLNLCYRAVTVALKYMS